MDVTVGSLTTQFLANPGPNEVWVPVPTDREQVDSVRLSTTDGTTVCVAELEAGIPVPRED